MYTGSRRFFETSGKGIRELTFVGDCSLYRQNTFTALFNHLPELTNLTLHSLFKPTSLDPLLKSLSLKDKQTNGVSVPKLESLTLQGPCYNPKQVSFAPKLLARAISARASVPLDQSTTALPFTTFRINGFMMTSQMVKSFRHYMQGLRAFNVTLHAKKVRRDSPNFIGSQISQYI
jgi:hypothetical protein